MSLKKIITATSRKEDELQLADKVAGAIRAKTWENNPVYYRTFAGKIADLWTVK